MIIHSEQIQHRKTKFRINGIRSGFVVGSASSPLYVTLNEFVKTVSENDKRNLHTKRRSASSTAKTSVDLHQCVAFVWHHEIEAIRRTDQKQQTFSLILNAISSEENRLTAKN
jgi:hypothetical protein